MTEKRVALIRGINVGRAKRIAMADLRALVEGLGYRDVRTLLNSGNVVFTDPNIDVDSAVLIEKALADQLSISAQVIVLSSAEIATIIKGNPLGEVADNPSRFLIAILSNPADRERLGSLTEQDWAPEVIAIGERVAYLWCPNGILVSRLPEAIGRILGNSVTTRNWATVTKLHTLLCTE
ncbi:DUF1697 domain-containing protein [Desulfosporosinus sp. SB140]|uniref:DUF1697 domain-containing protein n=1 Tax=Desulfosporosinus paludis TaxID=3115649 RepID=UPI003890BC59